MEAVGKEIEEGRLRIQQEKWTSRICFSECCTSTLCMHGVSHLLLYVEPIQFNACRDFSTMSHFTHSINRNAWEQWRYFQRFGWPRLLPLTVGLYGQHNSRHKVILCNCHLFSLGNLILLGTESFDALSILIKTPVKWTSYNCLLIGGWAVFVPYSSYNWATKRCALPSMFAVLRW